MDTSFVTSNCRWATLSQESLRRQMTTPSRNGFWLIQELQHSALPTGICSHLNSGPEDTQVSSPAMSSNGFSIPSPSGIRSTAFLTPSNRMKALAPLQPETPSKLIVPGSSPAQGANILAVVQFPGSATYGSQLQTEGHLQDGEVEIWGNRAGLKFLAEVCLGLSGITDDALKAKKAANHYHFADFLNSAEEGSVPMLVTLNPNL